MRSMLVVLVVGLLSAQVWADDDDPDIEAAIRQAGQADKALIVEFHASWCGPCKAFEETTLKDERVLKALSGVVFVRYDIDLSKGSFASNLYGVKSVPTLVVIDKFGVEQARKSGALVGPDGVEEFLAIIERARNLAGDEDRMRRKLQTSPSAETRLQAATWFMTHGKSKEALPLFDQVSVDTSASSAQRTTAVRAATHRRRTDVWKAQVIAEKAAIVEASPIDASDEEIIIATVDSNLGSKDRAQRLDAVLAAHTDVQRLNGLVTIALAAKQNATALKHAKRLAELRRDVPYMATLAECYAATGDREAAVKLLDEAAQMAKWSPIYKDVLAARRRILDTKLEAPAVVEVRQRAHDIWKRLETADELSKPVEEKPEDTEQLQRMRQSWQLRFGVEHKLAAACKKSAGTAKLAVGRVTVDVAGAIVAKVWLLEPGVPATLEPCLDGALQGAVLVGPATDTLLHVRLN